MVEERVVWILLAVNLPEHYLTSQPRTSPNPRVARDQNYATPETLRPLFRRLDRNIRTRGKFYMTLNKLYRVVLFICRDALVPNLEQDFTCFSHTDIELFQARISYASTSSTVG